MNSRSLFKVGVLFFLSLNLGAYFVAFYSLRMLSSTTAVACILAALLDLGLGFALWLVFVSRSRRWFAKLTASLVIFSMSVLGAGALFYRIENYEDGVDCLASTGTYSVYRVRQPDLPVEECSSFTLRCYRDLLPGLVGRTLLEIEGKDQNYIITQCRFSGREVLALTLTGRSEPRAEKICRIDVREQRLVPFTISELLSR
ncbi:MAG: hypothetical protein SFV17_17050 [Candidatus Obscuribacter sp.]|nr:hypothetical protein [Candidatus Obscuribacter sp.]